MKNSFITVTDQFCGAGGSSQGARELSRSMGGGLEVKLALNHWKLAIETHNTNFPDTLHDCTDVSACDPRRYPKTHVLITSPECTNHSLAKGKKRGQQPGLFTALDPAEERSRATMWDVPRFADYHQYELIIVENVVDARMWIMWDAWLMAMRALGYQHECVYLNSMFCWPTPQSRDRMYVVFWKKGNRRPNLAFTPLAYCPKCGKDTHAVQSWRNPKKRWGKYKQQYDYRCPCGTLVNPYYHAAFNCIDWSLPAQRIGDRTRPLAPNTIKRIQHGLDKYGNDPMVIATRYTSGIDSRVKSTMDPIGTQPGDVSHAILQSFIVRSGYDHAPKGVDKPIGTITGQHDAAIVHPFLINLDHSKSDRCFDRSASEPLRSLTTADCTGVVVPFLIKNYGGNLSKVNADQPTGTITGTDHHGLVGPPFIVENFGTSHARSVMDRMGCLTGEGKYGIVTQESFQAFLTYYYGRGHQTSKPNEAVDTITAGERSGLVTTTKPRIEDCTYRMLQAEEVKLAMAFERDYIVLGNSRQKVKQCGNAVTPPAMRFLLERGIETLK